MSFWEIIDDIDIDRYLKTMESVSEKDVESVLSKDNIAFNDFFTLISPSAKNYLEQMAQKAMRITRSRFGNTIEMYVPLYVSNVCYNRCVYCGFNVDNKETRYTLSYDEIEREASAIKKMGFDNILIVSGDAPNIVSIEYLSQVVDILKKYFDSVSIEIYPLSEEEYQTLFDHGVDGVAVYQETYLKDVYDKVHLSGKKKDYRWRLETPERAGRAGYREIGIGFLMGLAPWRKDAVYLFHHINYLMKSYWQAKLSVSFPRINPALGGYRPEHPVETWEMSQLMFALRIVFPDIGIVLSTRENAKIRDNLFPICVTKMSAGSKTSPGGYEKSYGDEQFHISDERTPKEIENVVKHKGFDPVWKNWDKVLDEKK